MGDPVQALDIDAAVENHETASWQVLRSEPRWDLWRDTNRLRPPDRSARRGRIAAKLAGVIVGVVAVGGVASYTIQFQGLRNDAVTQVSLGSDAAGHMSSQFEEGSPQWGVENAARASRGTSGFIAVVDGTMLATTPSVKGAADDAGFIKAVAEAPNDDPSDVSTYVSPSVVCIYTTAKNPFASQSQVVVNAVDLTPALVRMNLGYLTYGLVGLGLAGAAGGVQYWRLGRGRNSKAEPDVASGDPT